MKNKKKIFRILFTLIIAFCIYYVTLPPINLSDSGFYTFALLIIAIYFLTGIISVFDVVKASHTNFASIKKQTTFKVLLIVIASIFVLINLVNFIASPLFMSNSYYSRIAINENTSFTDDIKEVDFEKLPLLDKDSSQKLGNRTMGQIPELVSQFEVSNMYTQINYNDEIIRVTPLEYASIIKYFTNRKEGVKAYIKVNSVNGNTELVKLDKGMKYMPSALFFENLERHLRFLYPFAIFDTYSFEIDNDGNPYWIVPTIKYTAVGLKKEINGVIIVNPVDGSTKKYALSEIPSWIDHVFNADLIIEQVNDWGKYKNGYINSVFGQKNVVATTSGYNYLIKNDDVYLYTGITSVSSDESNIGFILTNLRTKQTSYYNVPGAEEYSAMASAEGQVQQMQYTSTFPLLINLNNRPTYLVSLKDDAGLVKMYGFIDVEDYQKVSVTDASLGIEKAKDNYVNNVKLDNTSKDEESTEITIKSITTAVYDGNTYYYIKDTFDNSYKISIKVNESALPFIKIGDTIIIKYYSKNTINEVSKLTINQ